jgi:hypothetical protein
LVAAWLMGFALATRWAVLGDLAYFNDEYFYWVAALRIHDGLLPYVNVWDRKGPGLFLTYWLITGVYRGVLGFQVAALLSTAATAFTLARIARRFTGPVARWGRARSIWRCCRCMAARAGKARCSTTCGWRWQRCCCCARAALEAGRLSGERWARWRWRALRSPSSNPPHRKRRCSGYRAVVAAPRCRCRGWLRGRWR